jgi:hypothetical protein
MSANSRSKFRSSHSTTTESSGAASTVSASFDSAMNVGHSEPGGGAALVAADRGADLVRLLRLRGRVVAGRVP